MQLTRAQQESLYTHGLVRFPEIVPKEVVNTALRAVNSSLGTAGIDPEQLVTFRSQSYCPELQRSQEITDLLTASPLWELAESAVGAGAVAPVRSGQIALRFPSTEPPHDPHPHIDGMYSPHNGVPEGTIQNFTALIGVFLSDVPAAYSGNFTVWPGTHRAYETYFREHGPQSLLDGMPAVELPEPEQVTAKAGDAVLCHYQIGHGIAGNASPNTRYAVFFRLSHVDHDSQRWECMTDIWREWAGMRDVVTRAATGGEGGKGAWA
ncbi:phytanoyl-CoA dioxygenase family protein [Actinopolymorpha alba]|uniref:phytanoyl-CoA dioxygenase family protein n=1 Tax=Actinopolymorpha alba TaxID=533267 RepID=UPI00036A9001|nr:hypothetical protein [Actinopolymorpha alba]